MRILVIPDIHEDLGFLNYILTYEGTESFDHIVLLGDYFDAPPGVNPCDQRLRQVAERVLEIKQKVGDRMHLLCGNHDLPYYALRPACGNREGRPNRRIGDWLVDTTQARAEIINEVWDDAFWRDLKGAVLLDDWLFSHAGVHPRWWSEQGKTSAERMACFDAYWSQVLNRLFVGREDPICAIGPARGGADAAIPGPLWQDWEEEFEDALEVPQIVGHTRDPEPAKKGRSYCLDMAQTAYAIVEAGTVRLNQVPDSGLE